MVINNPRIQRAKQQLGGWWKEQSAWSLVGICLAMTAFMSTVYSYRIFNPVNSDFGNHNQFARDLLARMPMPAHITAHPFYQWTLAGLVWLSRSRMDVDHASVVLMVLSQLISALLIYFWLGNRQERFSEVWRSLIAVGVSIAAPVFLLLPLDGQFYFGYIGLANYHNPTVTYLRPFALLMLISSLTVFSEKKDHWVLWLFVAFITASGTMVKPNYTLVLIPALSLLVLIAWIGKKPIQWSMYLALVLPGMIILGWQFISTYAAGGEHDSQIIFAPLVSELSASGNLLPKFLLSLFFVFSVWVVTKGAFLQDQANQITGLTFLFSAGLLYLMAESGNRLEHGNFRWGAQIALFLLMVSAIRYIWKKPNLSRRETMGAVIGLGVQVICGLIYWLHCLTSKGYG